MEFQTDAAGRLGKVLDQQRTYASGFEYKGFGALGAVNLGNGTREEYGFNETSGNLQLTQQKLLKGGKILEQYNYFYGQVNLETGAVDTAKNNGQLAKVESLFDENNQIGVKQWEQRFGYDELGRLSEVREHDGTPSGNQIYKNKFNYDRFGNQYRNAGGQSGAVTSASIAEGAMATSGDIDKNSNRVTPQTGTIYDDAGNVTTDTKFRAFNYRYDANNRMILAQSTAVANAPQAGSVYDAAGQRVATRIGEVWTVFVYDIASKMIAEYGGTPQQTSSSVQYLFTDRQGSTRATTDVAGAVTGRMDYTAFGEDIGAGVSSRTTAQGYNNTNQPRDRFAQTQRDEATGLDHTPWRKNESAAGRWTSPDPYKGSMSVGDPQSFNRYAYTQNDPVNMIDPSGLFVNVTTPVRQNYYEVVVHIQYDWWDAFIDVSVGYGGGGIGNWIREIQPTGGDPSGTGLGTGVESPSTPQSDLDKKYQNCLDVIKELSKGVWNKVQQLLKNPPIINIENTPGSPDDIGSFFFHAGGKLSTTILPNDVASSPGYLYLGSNSIFGETTGETFDRIGSQALTIRGMGSPGIL